jgi:hypothetical protein
MREFAIRGILVTALLGLGALSAVKADVLLLDAIAQDPPNTTDGLMRPHRGESMVSVRGGYGEPTTVKGPVGEPPITRWVYPGYTVYFEYQTVIDVVVHRP